MGVVTLTIDDKEIKAREAMTILEAARSAGIDIPTLCFHEKLKPYTACRLCIVDMVKYFLTFLSNESCGKCIPCREGLRQMIKILNNITEGRGKKEDLELLEVLSTVQKKAALCALGQGASNTMISTLKHFRNEYEAHIEEKRCPAHVCNVLSATKTGGRQ